MYFEKSFKRNTGNENKRIAAKFNI